MAATDQQAVADLTHAYDVSGDPAVLTLLDRHLSAQQAGLADLISVLAPAVRGQAEDLADELARLDAEVRALLGGTPVAGAASAAAYGDGVDGAARRVAGAVRTGSGSGAGGTAGGGSTGVDGVLGTVVTGVTGGSTSGTGSTGSTNGAGGAVGSVTGTVGGVRRRPYRRLGRGVANPSSHLVAHEQCAGHQPGGHRDERSPAAQLQRGAVGEPVRPGATPDRLLTDTAASGLGQKKTERRDISSR